MVNFNQLKDAIGTIVKANGRGEISGDALQGELFRMVDAIEDAAFPETDVYGSETLPEDFRPIATARVGYEGVQLVAYRFYYRIDNLPNNTSRIYSLANMMGGYDVRSFTRVSGFVDNGHMVSNGRIDNTDKVVIAQQLGRISKELTLRTYANLSDYKAILEIEFIGIEKEGIEQ